jgi:sugar phosphate permease
MESMKNSTETAAPLHWAWVILAVCFINLFINYSIRLGYGVVLPEMIRDLGFSRTAAGSIYNAYLFSYIAFTPLTGYLTDRFGARLVITTCTLILAVGVLLMGTVTNLGMACLYYAIAGLGSTGMWTPVITLAQRWYAVDRRGMALGILSTGYGLGFASMGVAFPFIVHHLNWRYAWYFLGSGALIMIFINGFFIKSTPESAGYAPWGQRKETHDSINDRQIRSHGTLIKAVFKTKTFWFIGFSYFSISYCIYGFTTFMVDYAKFQIGLPLEKASLLATVHGVCQIIGVLTIVPLSDYLGRKKTLILSNIFITVTIGSILFAGQSVMMLFILVGFMAVFHGATWPTYGACAGDYFPKELMGTVIGVWTPFYGLGAILAHWAGGILRDSSGVYDQAFLINTIMAGIAFLLMCAVKRERI